MDSMDSMDSTQMIVWKQLRFILHVFKPATVSSSLEVCEGWDHGVRCGECGTFEECVGVPAKVAFNRLTLFSIESGLATYVEEQWPQARNAWFLLLHFFLLEGKATVFWHIADVSPKESDDLMSLLLLQMPALSIILTQEIAVPKKTLTIASMELQVSKLMVTSSITDWVRISGCRSAVSLVSSDQGSEWKRLYLDTRKLLGVKFGLVEATQKGAANPCQLRSFIRVW